VATALRYVTLGVGSPPFVALLRTTYATLSGAGRLVAGDWQRPGLALSF
jgi:hypothetical protein